MQIGNIQLKNRFFLAPLAGVSNLPFRLINKEFGCALVYTEMISAQGLIRKGKNTKALLLSNEKEKPVSYQIFGTEPLAMRSAAIICEDYGADILDINMGCPVKKVILNGAGCALLDELEKVRDILREVRKSIKIPLTIKLRLGMGNDKKNYLKVAEIAESEGVDAICLHPRTKNQQFKGDIDISALKKLKESVKIPVIGSGNLFSADDARNMLEKSGCDAVMIARGALGNPFIFRELIEGTSEPITNLKRLNVIKRHVAHFLQYYSKEECHREMKKHIIWYTKGISASSSFRKKVVTTNDIDEMMTNLEEFLEGVTDS